MIEIKVTQEQSEAAIEMAEEKIDRILEKGPKEVLETAMTLNCSQIESYLHDKALEQCQINAFLKLLKVHNAIKDICTLEKHYIKEVPEKAKEEIKKLAEKYNNNVIITLGSLGAVVYENGKMTKCYEVWNHMLQRCYDSKYHEKYSTYKDCEVVEEWLNLQNFGNWFDDNYYEVKNEKMCLDKDILNKGNKIYSPNNCIFVPDKINTLFVKCNKSRGDYPIGVCYHKSIGKFIARCSIYDFKTNKSKNKHLGYYDTPNEAFKIYKQFKEKYIKEVADCYKDFIPIKLYDAMYNYKIDIDD